MASKEAMSILVAGGDQDFNLHALVETLATRGHDVLFLRVGKDHHPSISWTLGSAKLTIDGREVRPDGAFVRHDVFTHLEDRRPASAQRAFAWYTAISGWLGANTKVRCLNRLGSFAGANKPFVLHLAREEGLAIPKTLISNDLEELDRFLADQPKIAKPINGGGYCQKLTEATTQVTSRRSGIAAAPAIVQRELVPPEHRVYRIGDRYLGFEVISRELDYRTTRDCRVELWQEIPEDLVSALGRLMDRLGLDFGAADFKACPDTGQLLFLEVNSGPMFAAFDRAAKGSLTGAIAAFLAG